MDDVSNAAYQCSLYDVGHHILETENLKKIRGQHCFLLKGEEPKNNWEQGLAGSRHQ